MSIVGKPSTKSGHGYDRRNFLSTALGCIAGAGLVSAQTQVTRPEVSETACPLETIAPIARDGYRGQGVLRKPPGKGPFPAIIWVHPGMTAFPLRRLQSIARNGASPLRFLVAGYVVVVPTYRSRDIDPQSTQSFEDTLAVVEYVRKLPYVDSESIVVYGCSGGGDLALEVAAATKICALVPEEPATVLMSGMFNSKVPKKGELYAPPDIFYLLEDARRYYTPEYQEIMRAKVARIQCPILIVQGDEDRREDPINKFNAVVLIPELRAAKKTFRVAVYPGQSHCFCFMGGVLPRPAPPGLATPPASAPRAAQAASREIELFCRRYLKAKPRKLDSHLVKYVAAT